MLLALLLLAVVPPLAGIVQRGLFGDEAFSLMLESAGLPGPYYAVPTGVFRAQQVHEAMTRSGGPGGIIAALAHWSNHPPAYFIALSTWKDLVASSLVGSRFFSLLCHTLLVLLVYLLAVAARLERPLMASAVYALSVLGVEYAGVIRPYTFVAFLLALQVWLASVFTGAGDHPQSRWYAGLGMGVTAALVLHSDYLMAAPSAFVFLWTWLQCRARPDCRLEIPVVIASAGLLLVIPLMLSAYLNHNTLEASAPGTWQLQAFPYPKFQWSDAWQILTIPLSAITGYPVFYYRPALNLAINDALLLVVGVPLAFGLWSILLPLREPLNAANRIRMLVLGVFASALVGLLILITLTGRLLAAERIFVPVLPFLALIVACGLERLLTRMRWFGVLCVVGLFLTLAARNIDLRVNPLWIDRYDSIAQLINGDGVADAVLVLSDRFRTANNLGSLGAALAPELAIRVFHAGESTDRVLADIERYRKVWLVFHPVSPDSVADKALLAAFENSSQYRADGLLFGARRYLAVRPERP